MPISYPLFPGVLGCFIDSLHAIGMGFTTQSANQMVCIVCIHMCVLCVYLHYESKRIH